MANRRISEFPAISGISVNEQDLLTLVHVLEVDPTLRNKKVTFTEFRNYLDQYYVNITGEIIAGDITITGNLTVSGATSLNTVTSTGLATFSGVVVQNNLTTTGTISGTVITGDTVRASTITGTTANFTSGNFINLFAVNQIFDGNLTFSGDTLTKGDATFESGITVTGTLSGTTITGTAVQATNITGVTLEVTTPSGATPAIVCSGVVSGDATGFRIQGPLIILP